MPEAPEVVVTSNDVVSTNDVSTSDTAVVATEKVDDEAVKPAESEPAKEEAPDPDRDKRREQRRLDRKIGNALRQAAEQRARAELLQSQLEEFKTKATPVAEGMPKLEDFSSVDDFAEAIRKHERKSAAKEFEEKQSRESAQKSEQQLLSSWESKVEKAHDKYEDFTEIVGELKPTSTLFRAVMQAENGDDVAYFLGKDDSKEGKRLFAMDTISQVLEIGRISARLSAQPQEVKKPSEAPAPIKTVGATNSPSSKKLTELTQDEFEKRRRQQIAQRK